MEQAGLLGCTQGWLYFTEVALPCLTHQHLSLTFESCKHPVPFNFKYHPPPILILKLSPSLCSGKLRSIPGRRGCGGPLALPPPPSLSLLQTQGKVTSLSGYRKLFSFKEVSHLKVCPLSSGHEAGGSSPTELIACVSCSRGWGNKSHERKRHLGQRKHTRGKGENGKRKGRAAISQSAITHQVRRTQR